MKTVLYDEHVRLGGKVVDFAGWEMPLWYGKGQSVEHHATRQAVGLYDICHMGEFSVTGANTLDFWSGLLSNDVKGMTDGQAMYNFMLNEKGGVIDDCILYRFNAEKWMLVVNAGNIAIDLAWLKAHATAGVEIVDLSNDTAKLDLQGPNAPKVIAKLGGVEALDGLRFFTFKDNVNLNGVNTLLSRTGYTGEIGFEIYCHTNDAVKLWNMLLEAGADLGIEPCGLGARDSLRTEAGLPLHGHEIAPDVPALATPWGFVFEWEHEFIGKAALEAQKAAGINAFVYPFVMNGRSKAMHGWLVTQDGKQIGTVLSGVISPTLGNKPIGFLRSTVELAENTVLSFNEEGKTRVLDGYIAASPFVKPTSRKKMSSFLN